MKLTIKVNGEPLELELPDGADVEIAEGRISVKVAEKPAPIPYWPIYPIQPGYVPLHSPYPWNQPIITWSDQATSGASRFQAGMLLQGTSAVS